MNIKIVDTFAHIFFKCVRTCLFYRKQSYFSDFVGAEYESGASDGETVELCCSPSSQLVLCMSSV